MYNYSACTYKWTRYLGIVFSPPFSLKMPLALSLAFKQGQHKPLSS